MYIMVQWDGGVDLAWGRGGSVVDLEAEYKRVSVYVFAGDLHSIQKQSCFGVYFGPPDVCQRSYNIFAL